MYTFKDTFTKTEMNRFLRTTAHHSCEAGMRVIEAMARHIERTPGDTIVIDTAFVTRVKRYLDCAGEGFAFLTDIENKGAMGDIARATYLAQHPESIRLTGFTKFFSLEDYDASMENYVDMALARPDKVKYFEEFYNDSLRPELRALLRAKPKLHAKVVQLGWSDDGAFTSVETMVAAVMAEEKTMEDYIDYLMEHKFPVEKSAWGVATQLHERGIEVYPKLFSVLDRHRFKLTSIPEAVTWGTEFIEEAFAHAWDAERGCYDFITQPAKLSYYLTSAIATVIEYDLSEKYLKTLDAGRFLKTVHMASNPFHDTENAPGHSVLGGNKLELENRHYFTSFSSEIMQQLLGGGQTVSYLDFLDPELRATIPSDGEPLLIDKLRTVAAKQVVLIEAAKHMQRPVVFCDNTTGSPKIQLAEEFSVRIVYDSTGLGRFGRGNTFFGSWTLHD